MEGLGHILALQLLDERADAFLQLRQEALIEFKGARKHRCSTVAAFAFKLVPPSDATERAHCQLHPNIWLGTGECCRARPPDRRIHCCKLAPEPREVLDLKPCFESATETACLSVDMNSAPALVVRDSRRAKFNFQAMGV